MPSRDELRDTWAEGYNAGWRDRTRSIINAYTADQEVANATPNPYEEKT